MHRGVAVNEILRETHESGCDMLVIGAQVERTTWLNELLMSTVTPQVVDRASCSVLVVRSKN
jgi:nucleotide-binding universal stress UspA family protein